MADMAIAHINGDVLAWARRRSGMSIESVATNALSPANILAWENKKSLPSESQAEALAARLGIAYPMLFMPEVPPDAPIRIPDLRTVTGKPISRPSIDFLEVLDDTLARQDWYREERIEAGLGPIGYVGRYSLLDQPKDVAEDIRKTLGITPTMRSRCKDADDFLKQLAVKAESSGTLVMRSGVVRHTTTRLLKLSEFRGFALTDAFVPVVFINDADAKAAQIFTLAHELAHVWIGEEGVSDRKPNDKNSKNTVEVFCDRVATELLVPEAEFKTAWNSTRSFDDNVISLVRRFRVSSLVVLRQAKDLGLMPLETFYVKVEEAYEFYRRKEEEKRESARLAALRNNKKPQGNFWASFDLRNSPTFNAAVVASVTEQRATFTDAAALFGVSLKATVNYFKRVSVLP